RLVRRRRVHDVRRHRPRRRRGRAVVGRPRPGRPRRAPRPVLGRPDRRPGRPVPRGRRRDGLQRLLRGRPAQRPRRRRLRRRPAAPRRRRSEAHASQHERLRHRRDEPPPARGAGARDRAHRARVLGRDVGPARARRAGQAERSPVGGRPGPRAGEPGRDPRGHGVRDGVQTVHAWRLRGLRRQRRPVRAHDARRPRRGGGAGRDRARARRGAGGRPPAVIAERPERRAATRVARRSRRIGPVARRRERWFYLLIAPWLVGLVVFKGGPLLAVVGMSLAEWDLAEPARFGGLENLTALARDPLFARSLVNTAYYAAGLVPLGLAIGLALALLLHRPRRGVRVFRTLVFLPAVLSGVATALLWSWVFNP